MKALFFKYDMAFEDGSWQTQASSPGIRVEKRVRMRVQVRCHICRNIYSSSTGCPQCHHPRCDQCVRHPGRRKAADAEGADEEAGEPGQRTVRRRRLSTATDGSGTFVEVGQDTDSSMRPIDSPERRRKRREKPSTGAPSSSRGSRRAKHKHSEKLRCCACQRSFARQFSPCPRCNHKRCNECPQKVPGVDQSTCDCQELEVDARADANGSTILPQRCKNPQNQVQWTCHKCHTSFPGWDGRCSCGHHGCDQCLRLPPKRPPNQVYLHPGTARPSEPSPRISPEDTPGSASNVEDSESSFGGLLKSEGVR